ncbi:MAG TPA: M13 family metallopeptidase, partial [Candidatus Udaeobacter sp.]|nr:M13 family metallopeptidase [Candidatus Udaeobacter sp.]
RQDFKNSTATIAFLSQGGLGLPDRDYYFRADSQSTALRSAYRIHIERTLALSGIPAAESRPAAERILGLETALAAASRTNVEVRDPKSNYHAMSRSQLAALSPRVAWKEYFGALGTPELGTLNVAQPGFFHALDSLWSAVPLEDWKLYLRWHAARFASPWLSSAFVNENFSFESRLTGEKELKPRWKRCMAATDVALGEALGRQFVARYFTPATRQRALAMIGNLEAALRERLGTLEWMSDSTRTQALAKLRAFQRKIGYPDRWRDYSRLSVAPGSFLANRENAEGFEFRRRLAKIGKPVDRTEWTMTPPTVNAYYNSSMNEIVFPAGILQPPFFDPQADDAFNYGGIGTVIGHEMTHGFDDRGRQFDAAGNLRDWWTPADADRFKARAGRIIDQFNGYVAVDTVHVNGRLTTGENIADLGGLAIAYRAYQHARAGHPEPVVDGFTGDQRFFLAFAQIWREQVRPELARQDAATNPHSPGRWRVNGPLSNLPEFARAFGCREGDAMVRADDLKVRIW